MIIERTATGFKITRSNTNLQENTEDQEIVEAENISINISKDPQPEEVTEESQNQEDGSGIFEKNQEGGNSCLAVSDDEGELVEKTELEPALHDMGVHDGTKVEITSSCKRKIQLPEGVTEKPRNEEEMHLGLLKNNPDLVRTYLDVSDDDGEMLGIKNLILRAKEITKKYAKPTLGNIKDHTKALEELTDMATELSLQLNMVENKYGGATTKCRIIQGILLNIIKEFLRVTKAQKWLKWFEKAFGSLRELRSVQGYMGLADVDGIIRYSFLGKERLVQIVRQLTEADKKTADPIGTFIARNGIDFNPEEEVDVEELKIETDIAIECQKLHKAELEIPKEMIDTLVRNRVTLTQAHIDELKIVESAGVDAVDEKFQEIIASNGKLKPIQTQERKAKTFEKITVQFINQVESAINDHEYLVEFKSDLIVKLKDNVRRLEEMLQAITEESTVPSSDEVDSSQAPAEGEGMI